MAGAGFTVLLYCPAISFRSAKSCGIPSPRSSLLRKCPPPQGRRVRRALLRLRRNCAFSWAVVPRSHRGMKDPGEGGNPEKLLLGPGLRRDDGSGIRPFGRTGHQAVNGTLDQRSPAFPWEVAHGHEQTGLSGAVDPPPPPVLNSEVARGEVWRGRSTPAALQRREP